MFRGRFLVAPSSYTKLVRAGHRQRIYLYLVQFSGILLCWLQKYHARIRTLGSSLVYMFFFSKLLFLQKILHGQTVWIEWGLI